MYILIHDIFYDTMHNTITNRDEQLLNITLEVYESHLGPVDNTYSTRD